MADTILAKTKLALRLKTSAFDDELTDLIASAKEDLVIAGVFNTDDTDPIIARAIVSYVKLHFGTPYEEANARKSYYANLKSSYDEQKAQLSMATGYTSWDGVPESEDG